MQTEIKMKNTIKYLSIVFVPLAIIAGGIAFAFRKPIKTYFIPTVEQIGDINIKVENDTCYVSSKLTASNKSFLKIEVDTIKYKVSMFGKTYLQNKEYIGMILKGYSKDTIDFALKIPYIRIIKDLKKKRKNGDSASYFINVSLQYSTFLGQNEMPINKSAKLKIPQPPELEILDIKYTKIRMKSILADVKVKITNYTDVNLSIKEMGYSMNVLKQGILKGKHEKEIDIKPNASTIIELPIEISPKNITRTFFDILINKDSYDYTLTLDAILESSVSIKESFRIHLVKSGEMELRK
jgi:LEA14-like dessication related protein